MAESFERLEKCHEGSTSKQDRRTTHLIVRPLQVPSRRRFWRIISSAPGKHTRQAQTIQAATTEAPPHLAVPHDQPQIDMLPDLEHDLMTASAASQDPPDYQLGHASEMSPDTPSHESPSLDVGCEFPSIPEQVDDIEITCEDGSIAFIPAGTDRGDGDEGIKTQMALVKATDKLSITRTPQDANIPLSDADELLDFLAKGAPADGVPAPDGTASAKSATITSLFRLKFESKNSEDDADGAKSDPPIIRFLCIERFFLLQEENSSEIVARRPCHQFPRCDHAHIQLLGGGVSANELDDSDVGAVILAPQRDDRDLRAVRLFKGFETFVYQKCTGPCDHTQAEVGDAMEDAVVHCIRPLRMLALVGTAPIGSGDEETSDDEHSSDGSSDNSGDEAVAHAMGPFRSVPCLFCRKTALNPELKGEKTSESVIRYGTHSYGYRCARCQKISFITGAQPVGFEGEATGDDSERELTVALVSSAAGLPVTAGQVQVPRWANWFGF